MDLCAAVSQLEKDVDDERTQGNVVSLCHRMAMAYLNQKVRLGALNPQFFGLTLEDLALDCIADLFERDDTGCCIHLQQYFRSISWRELDEPGLEMALRRIVFSKVNEGLFRRYREQDPGLARIIRNLKIAIGPDSRFMLVRHGSETLISPTVPNSSRTSLPNMPPEIMEAFLIPEIGSDFNIKRVLTTLFDLLRSHPQYNDSIPLSVMARSIRSAHIILHAHEDLTEEDPILQTEELETLITATLDQVSQEAHASYVSKNKVSEETFEVYFLVIRDVLTAEYAHTGNHSASYFETMQSYFPTITRAEYAVHDRNVLEYLGKLVKKRLTMQIRRMVRR